MAFATLAASCRDAPPDAVVVFGSGMGALRRVRVEHSIPFADAGLPRTSVAGHKGTLTLGEWAGRRILVFEGRLHYYEGHAWETVERPIWLAAELGARVAMLTNAAGGIAEGLEPGSLMAVRDHIEWTRPDCWRQTGAVRPSPYSPRLLTLLGKAAIGAGLALPQGVYAAVTGPSYETPAEIRALRVCGADAVGMSTAREVLAGVAAGMDCGAVSLIANRAAGLGAGPLTHADVLAAVAAAGERMIDLLERFLAYL
jgi:purine-nucleoside phosphorylase